MICPTNTQLSWAVEAARVGLKKSALLLAVMANWAVAQRQKRYQDSYRWRVNHRDRFRELNRLSYERTKILKGRPARMSPEEKRIRRAAGRKRRWQAILFRERWRRRNEPMFAIRERLRATMRCALSRQFTRKSARTVDLIGCTPTELKAHIESLFVPGMSWANRNLWHVDHIRPLASFDLRDPDQQRTAFNWKNLQPLWSEENRKKGARLVQ